MTFLPLARNSRSAPASSASVGWVPPSSFSRSSATAWMRESPAATCSASVRSHSSVSSCSWPRACSKARWTGSPDSCSTSRPSGAISSAARAGTRGTPLCSTPTSTPTITSSTSRCSTLRRPSRPRHRPEKNERKVTRALPAKPLDLFLDARGLAGQVAQVVELGAAHAAAALDGDVADGRAVGLEHALHTLAVRDLAHGEGGVQPAIAPGDHHTLVGLHALAVAFDHLHLHHHGVAGPELRHLARHALLVDFLDYLAHVRSPRSSLGRLTAPKQLLQRALRLARERRARQQVGPAYARTLYRARQAPAADRRVITRQQHGGHRAALEKFRPRIVRPLEQSLRERVLLARALIPERSRQQPRQRIDDQQRRQFPAGEHVVAHRHLAVDAELDDALVHALVPSRHQQQPGERGELARQLLTKGPALRRQVQPHTARRQPRMRRADRGEQRAGLHHHPGSPAIRAVIDRAMHVRRVRARILRANAQQPAPDGAAHDTKLECSRDHARKQRHHLDLHRAFYASSTGQSTRISRAARSTRRRCRGAAGTQCSRPCGSRVTISAPEGASTKWLTQPKSAPSRLRTAKPTRSAR